MVRRLVLGGLGAVLVGVGLLGFLAHGERGATSSAPAYNVFHLGFGLLGLGLAAWGDPAAARAFFVGFGLVDLYQALASHQHWFPEALFRWTRTDDLLHLVIGAGLVVAGAAF